MRFVQVQCDEERIVSEIVKFCEAFPTLAVSNICNSDILSCTAQLRDADIYMNSKTC